ncbi:hypothetical protein ACLOJK_040007 [Asimina triloba]
MTTFGSNLAKGQDFRLPRLCCVKKALAPFTSGWDGPGYPLAVLLAFIDIRDEVYQLDCSAKQLTQLQDLALLAPPRPLYQKAACGLTAGAIGACVGSPADLALIRMQADATLPAAQRRNYTNAFQALYRIVADEGVLALWKGAGPTVVIAMALNMGMLASYDQSVELFRDNLGLSETSTVVGASAVSGFFAAACSLPFDYVKTQIQKMQPDASGNYPYSGSTDCAMNTLRAGGPFKFYTGFPVYCVRIAPHVMNQIQKIEKNVGL